MQYANDEEKLISKTSEVFYSMRELQPPPLSCELDTWISYPQWKITRLHSSMRRKSQVGYIEKSMTTRTATQQVAGSTYDG